MVVLGKVEASACCGLVYSLFRDLPKPILNDNFDYETQVYLFVAPIESGILAIQNLFGEPLWKLTRSAKWKLTPLLLSGNLNIRAKPIIFAPQAVKPLLKKTPKNI